MARYIDANELQKRLTKIADEPDYLHENETWDTGICLAGTQVDLMPTADVVEVKHGEWIEKTANEMWYYECPFCDFGYCVSKKDEHKPNYCEECGAKMDGERRDT